MPYEVSRIRTSALTTTPLSSPLFALCVCCLVFEEEKELPCALWLVEPAIWARNSQLPQRPIDRYWGEGGVVGVMGDGGDGTSQLAGGVKLTRNRAL
jgi:hypothetical protein